MRKLLKRVSGLVLAAAVAFSPAAGYMQTAIVFAEGTGVGEAANSISITVEGAVEGHTYKVYQVFTGTVGDVDETGAGKIGNVKYGQNYCPEGKQAGDAVPASELTALTDAKAFAKSISGMLSGEAYGTLTSANASMDAEPGYYLIMDEAGSGKGDSASDFLLQVAGNATFKPKSAGVPEFDKVIEEDREEDSGAGGDVPAVTPAPSEPEHAEHQYGEGEVTKPATCLENGEKTFTCECGDSYTEVIEATGHDYASEVTKEAGCVEEGEITYTCKHCGDSYSDPVDAIGHSYGEPVIKDSTCELAGESKATCSVCGDVKVEVIPAKGHQWTTEITKEAACEEAGIKKWTCANGHGHDEDIPATGHSYDEGTITTAATCTENGVKTYTCANCGGTKTETIQATGHNYTSEVTAEATCDGNGTRTYTCGNCHESYTEDIPALGHNYVDGVCGDCGETQMDLSPNTANSEWNYTLHEDTGVITLNYYKGNKTDVKVYSHYKVTGSDKIYKAELKSNTANDWKTYMFTLNKTVQSITFSNALDTSTCTDMSDMFSGCYALDSIDMRGLDTSNVTDMSNMFYACASLTSIDLSGFNTGQVGYMTQMFNGCTSLTTLDLSSFNTCKVQDMSYMFECGEALTSLDISSFDTSNVTTMDHMFHRCKVLTSLNLSSFNTANVTNMMQMFGGCTALVGLDLRSFDIHNATVTNMFYNCAGLTQVLVSSEKWVQKNNAEAVFGGSCKISEVTYDTEYANNTLLASGMDDAETHILPLAEAAGQTGASGVETTVKYGRGDHVPFSLNAIMPESIPAYDTYKLTFKDTLSDGLVYDDGSLKVYVGDTEVDASSYTVNASGQAITVTINDAKAAPFNAVAGTKISVKYTATLDDETAFRNINEAYLEYSNDPKKESSVGMTVSDTVTAFTFTLSFNKVDGSDGNQPLEGAGFTLYKKAEDGSYSVIRDEVKGVTAFSFSGLAVGDYKLVESTTPGGYNTMEDLVFTIKAVSEEDADGVASVTELKMVNADGTDVEDWEEDASTGIISSDIANYAGAVLPSTGGIGTTIFYVAGGLLVLAAGVLVIAKKKSKEEEAA